MLTNTAVRLKTRRAPRSHSGNFAPRSSSGRRARLWAAAWTRLVRWLFKTTARRGKDSEEFICCAGERGEPGETTTLSIESLLRCEEIRRIHTRLRWLCFTDDYIYCPLRTGRQSDHCGFPTVTQPSSHCPRRTTLSAFTFTRPRLQTSSRSSCGLISPL